MKWTIPTRRVTHPVWPSARSFRRAWRAFTLLEALIASAILLVVVLAVTQAITAGQQHSFEARQRIAGTLAAEELMGRIIVDDYANLATWDGYTESVGNMTDMNSNPLSDVFQFVGRDVAVTATTKSFSGLDVDVQGYDVRVRAFDDDGRVLAMIERFIAEPSS